VIIVARPTGKIPEPDSTFLAMPNMKDELRRISINGIQDLNIRLIGTKSVLDPLFASYRSPRTPTMLLSLIFTRYGAGSIVSRSGTCSTIFVRTAADHADARKAAGKSGCIDHDVFLLSEVQKDPFLANAL